MERDKKDRTGKSQGYISPICGEAPTEAMYMKICLVGDVLDVITCAKFQNDGYDFTGIEFSIFLIFFLISAALLRCVYCAACDAY